MRKGIDPKHNRKLSARDFMFPPPCSWGLSVCWHDTQCHKPGRDDFLASYTQKLRRRERKPTQAVKLQAMLLR